MIGGHLRIVENRIWINNVELQFIESHGYVYPNVLEADAMVVQPTVKCETKMLSHESCEEVDPMKDADSGEQTSCHIEDPENPSTALILNQKDV